MSTYLLNVIFKFFLLLFIFAQNAYAASDCLSGRFFHEEAQQKYEAGQYLLAAVHFKTASLIECQNEKKSQSLFGYAISMSKLGETNESLAALDKLEKNATPQIQEKLALVKKLTWNIDSNNLTADQKRRIQAWENRNIVPTRYKSPALAGTLSAIVPGAGHAYVGAWTSAAYSLILNTIMFTSAVELNQKGLHATSAAAWTLFSITYVGGILSSYEAAQLQNKNQISAEENQMHKQLFPELMP